MKAFLLAGAVASAVIVTPASAATIVQTGTEYIGLDFYKFNSFLGTLKTVTLEVRSDKNSRNVLFAPAGTVAGNYQIGWITDGMYYGNVGGSSFSFAMKGSGYQTISVATDLTVRRVVDEVSNRVIGSGVFNLPTASFIGQPGQGIGGGGSYAGYYNIADTAYTLPAGWEVIRSSPPGEDSNGTSFFKLTYEYEPFAVPSAVPESATWAMMLIGFGAIGGGMRRRQRVSVRFA